MFRRRARTRFAAKGLLVLGAAVLSLVGATQTQAKDLVMTFTGTANSITDSTNLFGLAPGVTEATFTDRFTFDLDAPGVFSFPGEIFGGSNFGLPTPLVSSSLTINGHTVAFQGGASDEAFYGPLSAGPGVQGFIGFGPSGKLYFNNAILYADPPADLGVPFSATGVGEGSFMICESIDNCNFDTNIIAGFLAPTSYTATISSGVPEPAAWETMLAGFTAVGGALRLVRRSQRRGAAAPA
jgi:hypothetical protein